jgi:NAD(P)-dependent dehydrogenase (short-subunit alcohol dehydrogenase family)
VNLAAGTHAFVTGGASGIGLGMADALARRGVRVTLADCNRDALQSVLAERGGAFQGVDLDVRHRQQWQTAKQRAEATFGAVDVLVNNAGIAPDGAQLADSNPESFERIIAVNLVGVYNGVVTFADALRTAGRGHILNVASIAGLSVVGRGTGAYIASKFAVVGLSETLRTELAPHGVGVSVLCPGHVSTNLLENTTRIGGRIGGAATMSGGLDPAVAGELAARGVERNDLYILTHFNDFEPVYERFRALDAAFKAGTGQA